MEEPVGIQNFFEQPSNNGSNTVNSPYTQASEMRPDQQNQLNSIPMSASKIGGANSENSFELPSQATPIVFGPQKIELKANLQEKPNLVPKKQSMNVGKLQAFQNQKMIKKEEELVEPKPLAKKNQLFSEIKFWFLVVLVCVITNFLWRRYVRKD